MGFGCGLRDALGFVGLGSSLSGAWPTQMGLGQPSRNGSRIVPPAKSWSRLCIRKSALAGVSADLIGTGSAIPCGCVSVEAGARPNDGNGPLLVEGAGVAVRENRMLLPRTG